MDAPRGHSRGDGCVALLAVMRAHADERDFVTMSQAAMAAEMGSSPRAVAHRLNALALANCIVETGRGIWRLTGQDYQVRARRNRPERRPERHHEPPAEAAPRLPRAGTIFHSPTLGRDAVVRHIATEPTFGGNRFVPVSLPRLLFLEDRRG